MSDSQLANLVLQRAAQAGVPLPRIIELVRLLRPGRIVGRIH